MDPLTSERFKAIYNRFKNQPRITQIKRIQYWPTQEQFEQISKEGYPLIMPSTAPDLHGQALSILSGEFGSFPIKARVGSYSDPNAYVKNRMHRDMSLNTYLKEVSMNTMNDAAYAGNQALPTEIAKRLGISPPSYYPYTHYEKPALWLGYKGTITPLHKDSTENFAIHMHGKKRWLLFPVRDTPYLYMSRTLPTPDSDFAPSAVDVRNIDLTKFPDFKKACPIEAIVSAGETLYLPAGWGHYVENLELTLMINYWLSIGMGS